MQFDRSKSLQQLEGQDWGEPTFDSHLVTECHRLRRVPLHQFQVEDLRIMIGQHISMEYLIPLALERLCTDPLAEGAFYPGDLLTAVLQAGRQFWLRHPQLKEDVAEIASRAASSFADTDTLREAHDSFQRESTTRV